MPRPQSPLVLGHSDPACSIQTKKSLHPDPGSPDCGPFSPGVCGSGEGPQEALHPSGYTCFYLLGGGLVLQGDGTPTPLDKTGTWVEDDRSPRNGVSSGETQSTSPTFPNTPFRLLCSNHWRTTPVPWLLGYGFGSPPAMGPLDPCGDLGPLGTRHTLYCPSCLHTESSSSQLHFILFIKQPPRCPLQL